MDLASLFGILMFAVAWVLHARTDHSERLMRLFFGTLMFMGAGIGFLALALRLLTIPA